MSHDIVGWWVGEDRGAWLENVQMAARNGGGADSLFADQPSSSCRKAALRRSRVQRTRRTRGSESN